MESNQTWWLPSNNSESYSSYNQTESINMIYLFTPAGVTAKLLLSAMLLAIGGMGLLGNCLIIYFLWKKPTTNPIQTSPFMRNLRLYVRSLSLSDLLACAVSLPLGVIQISFDIFQSGWPCKVVRFFNFIFPMITINNLVVISLERNLTIRTVPRTFVVSTVRKMIICAWVLGALMALFSAAPYDGVRRDLGDNHYTLICFYKQSFYPFRMSLIVLVFQYALPGVFITYVNIRLIKTVWVRSRSPIANAANNPFRASMRATSIKRTILLVALTLSFIIPYFVYLGNIIYTQIAKPQRDFPTEYRVRYGTGGVANLSGALNFVIYFAQMKDFREFLKKMSHGRRRTVVATESGMNLERQNTAARRHGLVPKTQP